MNKEKMAKIDLRIGELFKNIDHNVKIIICDEKMLLESCRKYDHITIKDFISQKKYEETIIVIVTPSNIIGAQFMAIIEESISCDIFLVTDKMYDFDRLVEIKRERLATINFSSGEKINKIDDYYIVYYKHQYKN